MRSLNKENLTEISKTNKNPNRKINNPSILPNYMSSSLSIRAIKKLGEGSFG